MNMSPARARLISSLALLFLFSGCATKHLSDENRKNINVIKISSNVVKAANMFYTGPGTGNALRGYAEKNGIFIEKIALEEVDAALRQSGKVKVADSGEPTEATLHVTVTQWGFSVPHGLSSDFVPIVSILCGIRNAADEAIWIASDYVLPLGNPVAPMSLEAIRDNPKLIEDAWRKASRQIAINIAKKL